MATDGLEQTLIVADVKWHRCFGQGEDCLVEWLLVDAGLGAEGTQLCGADMDLELAVCPGCDGADLGVLYCPWSETSDLLRKGFPTSFPWMGL